MDLAFRVGDMHAVREDRGMIALFHAGGEMSGTDQDSASESTAIQVNSSNDIQIVCLNLEKTHRINGSFTGYQAYFELSETPPSAWRDIFGREWNDLNPTQEAGIDGRFLVMHCPLLKIALQLPVMKRAVSATNEAYNRYAKEHVTAQDRQGDVWKGERKSLEEIARGLNFE